MSISDYGMFHRKREGTTVEEQAAQRALDAVNELGAKLTQKRGEVRAKEQRIASLERVLIERTGQWQAAEAKLTEATEALAQARARPGESAAMALVVDANRALDRRLAYGVKSTELLHHAQARWAASMERVDELTVKIAEHLRAGEEPMGSVTVAPDCVIEGNTITRPPELACEHLYQVALLKTGDSNYTACIDCHAVWQVFNPPRTDTAGLQIWRRVVRPGTLA